MTLLRELWGRLSVREQRMVSWSSVVVACLVIYGVVIDPMMERLVVLDRLIPQKRDELRQLIRLQAEYGQVKQRVNRIDRQLRSTTAEFSLLAFLEATAHQQVGKSHLAGIRPQPSLPFEGYEEVTVEVKLEQVSLAQIVAFLSELDRAPHRLRTKRLEIKSRFKEEEQLDASIVVAVYQLKASAAAQGRAKRVS